MRVNQRRALPRERPARDEHRLRLVEGLRTVFRTENIWLVRQHDEIDVGPVDVGQFDMRIAIGMLTEGVVESQSADQIAGERRTPDNHPGITPDRDRNSGTDRRDRCQPDLFDVLEPPRRLFTEGLQWPAPE